METTEMGNACDVLIVDDDEFNRRVAGDILKERFSICTAASGEETLEYLQSAIPKLILLDLHMPGMDGFETFQKIRENEVWKHIPIIFLTSDSKPETENRCLEIGAADFITKPFVPMVMLSRICRTIELSELQLDLEQKVEEKTELVEKVLLNSIMVIANTIDAKDAYTSGHCKRVAQCSVAIAQKLGWEEKRLKNLYSLALLHDIGKIGVPDAILNKPGRLSKEEFEVIKKHSTIGNDILKDIYIVNGAAEGALYHHERYDGNGYPCGLKGEEIPLCARIVGIADAYDAMASNRIYRPKLDPDKIIREFERGRGTQFDPKLTDIFLEMLKNGYSVSQERRSQNRNDGIEREHNAMIAKLLAEYSSNSHQRQDIDALTGLCSRSHGKEKIEKLLGEAHPGVLFMMDMDNFQQINDKYGHIVGDNVLRIFSDILRMSMGVGDVACRLGGDEFAVFYKDITDRRQIAKKARDILGMFSDKTKQMDLGQETTVSIGIAISPEDGKNYVSLYNNADKSLYFIKRKGKNAYMFYSNGKTKDASDTGTDLAHIKTMLEGEPDENAQQGAFRVEFGDFQRIYHYISRGVQRNRQQVQTLLFTLSLDESMDSQMDFEEPMQTLELAVASSVRQVDVGTRYSSIQYIVILLDTDLENGRKVADRVIKKFYQMYGGRGVVVSYDIQTMLPKKA